MVSLKIGERKYMPSWPTCFTSTISLINEETFMKWMFVEQKFGNLFNRLSSLIIVGN
jgi:hypothetical protein